MGAFDGAFTAPDLGTSKATPAFWTTVLEASGAEPRGTVVDDRPSVLRAAAPSGLGTILVDRAGTPAASEFHASPQDLAACRRWRINFYPR